MYAKLDYYLELLTKCFCIIFVLLIFVFISLYHYEIHQLKMKYVTRDFKRIDYTLFVDTIHNSVSILHCRKSFTQKIDKLAIHESFMGL